MIGGCLLSLISHVDSFNVDIIGRESHFENGNSGHVFSISRSFIRPCSS